MPPTPTLRDIADLCTAQLNLRFKPSDSSDKVVRKAAAKLGIGAKDGGKPKQVMQLARECHANLMGGGGGSGDGSPAQSYTSRAIPSLLPGGPSPAPSTPSARALQLPPLHV